MYIFPEREGQNSPRQSLFQSDVHSQNSSPTWIHSIPILCWQKFVFPTIMFAKGSPKTSCNGEAGLLEIETNVFLVRMLSTNVA